MELNGIKEMNHIVILNLKEIQEIDCEKIKDYNWYAIAVLIEEDVIESEIEEIRRKILSLPCISVTVFFGTVGKNALVVGSATHIRVAIADTTFNIRYSEILENKSVSALIGKEKKRHSIYQTNEIVTVDTLIDLGIVSNVFENLECTEFVDWLNLLFGNKSLEQLQAIKKCYDKYRFLMSNTSTRGILALEESKQFCLLANGIHKKQRYEE